MVFRCAILQVACDTITPTSHDRGRGRGCAFWGDLCSVAPVHALLLAYVHVKGPCTNVSTCARITDDAHAHTEGTGTSSGGRI